MEEIKHVIYYEKRYQNDNTELLLELRVEKNQLYFISLCFSVDNNCKVQCIFHELKECLDFIYFIKKFNTDDIINVL